MCSQVTKNTARRTSSRFFALALAFTAFALTGQTPAPVPPVPYILKNHVAALAALHLHDPSTHETLGTLSGIGLSGIFHEWQDGSKQRRDETLGIRTQRVLRVGDHLWMQNTSGEIRELHGLVARRQITEDFIDSAAFASHPEDVSFVDRATLPDGRTVYHLRVSPPKGEPYVVGIDVATYLIDDKSYVDGDRPRTTTYGDYRVVGGLLVPYLEIDSNGDHKYDVASHVTSVVVNQPIAADIFKPLSSLTVSNERPVTIPFDELGGLPFVHVTIAGKTYQFLLDSGAQGIVLDTHVAKDLKLAPQGSIEIRGAGRIASQGVVETPALQLGGVTVPSDIATVLELGSIVKSSIELDGIIGYPLFGGAEIRFDPDEHTVTIAKPGTLPVLGNKFDVDTDRELPEITASADNTDARFVVDTGNANEVLVFKAFMDEHPGVISFVGHGFVSNRGVGGSAAAVGATLDDLKIGPYHLYNRNANVMLASAGAFADRNDGGNIGFGVLRNFVTTFDLANHALYLQKARQFDDGRGRTVTE